MSQSGLVDAQSRGLYAPLFIAGVLVACQGPDTPAPTTAEARAIPFVSSRALSVRPLPLPVPPAPPPVPPTVSASSDIIEPLDERTSLSLSEITVTPDEGSHPVPLLVRAKATIEHELDTATYVQAKAVCQVDGRWMADTGYVNSDYAQALSDLERGESVDLFGSLFASGLTLGHGPCNVEFRLAGSNASGTSTLARACYSEGTTSAGPCPLASSPPSLPPSAAVPMFVQTLEVTPFEGVAGSGGLRTDYVVEIRGTYDQGDTLTLKAACTVDGTRFVAVRPTNLIAGPFRYEPGESVFRSANLFYEPIDPFGAPPEECDIEIALWRRPDPRQSQSQSEQLILMHACYRDGRTDAGPCSTTPAAPPAPLGEPLRLGPTTLQVIEAYGAKSDRYHLRIIADVTVLDEVDPFTSVTATVTCKVGNTTQVDTAYLRGVDLVYLDPGETARLTSTVFSSSGMAVEPNTCEAVFTFGKRFAPQDLQPAPLGYVCLRRGQSHRGKC